MHQLILALIAVVQTPANVQVQGTMAGESRVALDAATNEWSARNRLDLWLTPSLRILGKAKALRAHFSYEPILQLGVTPDVAPPYLLHRLSLAFQLPITRKTNLDLSTGVGMGTIDFAAANLPLQTPFGFLSRSGAIPIGFGGLGFVVNHRVSSLWQWSVRSMLSHFAVPTAPDGRDSPLQSQAHLEILTSGRTRVQGAFELAISADSTLPYLLAEQPRTPRGIPAYSSIQPELRWRQYWSSQELTFLRIGWFFGRQRNDYLFIETLPVSLPVVTIEHIGKPRRVLGLQHSLHLRGGLLPLYDPFLLGITERVFVVAIYEAKPAIKGTMRLSFQYDDKISSVVPIRSRSAETRDQLYRIQAIIERSFIRNLSGRFGIFSTFNRPWPSSRQTDSIQIMAIVGLQYQNIWST